MDPSKKKTGIHLTGKTLTFVLSSGVPDLLHATHKTDVVCCCIEFDCFGAMSVQNMHYMDEDGYWFVELCQFRRALSHANPPKVMTAHRPQLPSSSLFSSCPSTN